MTKYETRLRFACGSLLGGAFVFFTGYWLSDGEHYWLAVGVGALVSGLLAVYFGDGFYHAILAIFRNL